MSPMLQVFLATIAASELLHLAVALFCVITGSQLRLDAASEAISAALFLSATALLWLVEHRRAVALAAFEAKREARQ